MQGSRKFEDAVKRAKEIGFKDGKEGKEPHFASLLTWPEVEALNQRSFAAAFNVKLAFD
jgi:hypothetical protein